MVGVNTTKAREDVKPGRARSKTAQTSDNSKASSSVASAPASETRKKKKKKKVLKNGTPVSKDGEPKTSKKRKTRENGNQGPANGVTDRAVEVQSNVQTMAPQRKVQVKQRSFATLLETGSSAVAVGAAVATDAEAATTPAVDESGGFAGGNYGLLLETKLAEKLCTSLALEKRHVESMLRAFKREEQLGTGEITTGEFFFMLHEQPRQLTKGLFGEVGLDRNLRRMRFDDFVVCVATVATWSKSELLRYAFKQFDVDESGIMDGRELRAFCEGLRNDSSFYFAKNVNTARQKLVRNNHQQQYKETSGQFQTDADIEANTLVELEDLAKGSAEFQVAFYPLIQLQQNVRACALGERFWARVAQRRQEVEVIVHYMRMHKGQLPSFSMLKKIVAYLLPYSQANAQLVVHKLAVLKYAEEERIWQEQAQADVEAEKLVLDGIQEEGQPHPDPPK
ncbi:hypothetical protein PHYPSEUDO_000867 [Phytophthora pseudosyringae]|uniref:EF-hand domain-containing protein n=1 Tax=Phytophthora pseudosyringae TaxID=221518 RepID=A0A8T1VX33_9STRA|nr:hypothetical protein PHYPSEUDO_000867 [Phytophthora pseudosyringae]